jgi:hypothetical protein
MQQEQFMVEQITGEYQDISIEEMKKRPEIVVDWLLKDDEVSVIFEKQGQKIRFAYLRKYDSETMRILEDAKKEYLQKKKKGYSREQAFQDFIDAQQEISQQLKEAR